MSCANSNRTGTIDEGVAVAHEGRGGGGQGDAHLVMAGFGAGIADRSSGIDAAGAGNRTRARQYRFKKSGFTALERAHQRDAPWTAGTSDVFVPFAASSSGARPWIGSAVGCSPYIDDLASRKNVAAVQGEDALIKPLPAF